MKIRVFLVALIICSTTLAEKTKRGIFGESLGYANGHGLYSSGLALSPSYAPRLTSTPLLGHSDLSLAHSPLSLDLGAHVDRTITITNRVGVPIPQPYPVHIERRVPVAVPHPVPVPVDRPYPVAVPKPIAVPVDRPVPVPVDRPVPYPVKVPVKVAVPVPIKVAVPHPVPVAVPKPYPVHVSHPIIIKKTSPLILSSGLGYHHGGWNGGFGYSKYW